MEFSPNSIHKFDTHIQVNVRGWRIISLRVGGTIEPPCVDIDVVSAAGLLTRLVKWETLDGAVFSVRKIVSNDSLLNPCKF